METIKRVAAVSSLAAVGRCGLSVAVPVLSSMGHQACPVPTALFSSHPLGFQGYAVADCSEQMRSTFAHWQREAVSFDCCFSGYVASAAQICEIADFFESAAGKPMIVVDPVMGDNGRMYGLSREPMVGAYKRLLKLANIITPNLTEACLLLGRDYGSYGQTKDMLCELFAMSGASVVLKGVPDGQGGFANLLFNRDDESITAHAYEQVPAQYPGTGDIFAAILAGELLNGNGLTYSFASASKKTTLLVTKTYAAGTPVREGICLENNLNILKENL